MKLLQDYLLLEVEKEVKTHSGIILSASIENTKTGTVADAGEGTWEHGKWVHNQVQKGDIVQFWSNAGGDVKVDGKDYLLIRQCDVICILNREE